MLCFCSGSHPGHNITFSIMLVSPWLWQFLGVFLFLLTSIVLRCSDQVFLFCRMSLSWDLSVCLMSRWGWWFIGRRATAINAILIVSYEVYVLSAWLGTIDVDFDHLAEVVFVRFLPIKLLLLEESSSFWEEVPMHSPHLRRKSYVLPPRGQSIRNLFGTVHGRFVFSSQCVFIYSVINLYRYEFMHTYLIRWVIIQYHHPHVAHPHSLLPFWPFLCVS